MICKVKFQRICETILPCHVHCLTILFVTHRMHLLASAVVPPLIVRFLFSQYRLFSTEYHEVAATVKQMKILIIVMNAKNS